MVKDNIIKFPSRDVDKEHDGSNLERESDKSGADTAELSDPTAPPHSDNVVPLRAPRSKGPSGLRAGPLSADMRSLAIELIVSAKLESLGLDRAHFWQLLNFLGRNLITLYGQKGGEAWALHYINGPVKDWGLSELIAAINHSQQAGPEGWAKKPYYYAVVCQALLGLADKEILPNDPD